MARRGTGYVTGMKEAREALHQLEAAVQRQIGLSALNAAGDVFVGEIQRRAPVSARGRNPTPGSLKASVKKKASRSRKNLARIEIRADDVAAVPNELGTSKMPPHPFFRPGVDAKRGEAAQALGDKLRTEIESGPWVKGKE